MELRTVRRGLAALTTAALLGLAGASPAAAEEHGWLDQGMRWFSALWSAAEAQPGGGALVSIWTQDSVEKGYGMDPNGGGEQTVILPPDDGQ